MKAKKVIKAIAFMLIFGVLFFSVQALLYGDSDTRDYKKVTAFFEEREESLDAVFLGSSATYAFWTPAFAYGEYGITVYPLSTARQMLLSAKYLIDDARKTQPDALYIVNLVSVETTNNYVHRLLDGYPNTLNKYKMIDYLSDKAGYSLSERMEYYFPIIRFHSRWSELDADDFKHAFDKHEDITHQGYLMQTGIDSVDPSDNRKPDDLLDVSLPKRAIEYLDKMTALCREKGVELILVKAPTNSVRYYWYTEWDAQMVDYAEKNGLAYYSLVGKDEEMGLDWSTDTYDKGLHLNVYGAEKFTSYFGKILAENHGIEDRRSDSEISAVWEARIGSYYKERNGEK